MAIANSGMTLYTSNDTQQAWSASDGLDLEVFIQGVGSESWLVSKDSNETSALTLSANMATAKYVNVWMKSDMASFYTAIYMDLESTANNFQKFTCASSALPDISGDFKPSVLQIGQGVETGTYNPIAHSVLRVNVDNSASGNVRSITNHWIDAMYYGTGRTITGSTTTDKLFQESDVLDKSSDTYDGCTELIGGVIFSQTDIEINAALGNSYGETLVFRYARNTDNIYTLLINGTADFKNTAIVASNAIVNVDSTGATSFAIKGGSVTNGGVCQFAVGQTIDSTVFTGCDKLLSNGATLSGVTINATTSITGGLELQTSAELATLSGLTFNSYIGKYALYIPATVTGTITLDNFVGDGSGTDVYWAGTSGTLVINKSNGTNFTTWGSGGGTVSLVASVSITVNIKDEAGANISGALVYIDEDLGVVGNIFSSTTDVNGDISTSYAGGATLATIRVRKYGFKPFVGSIGLGNDSSTNVTLINDPQQN
jgi:hypothetical protein